MAVNVAIGEHEELFGIRFGSKKMLQEGEIALFHFDGMFSGLHSANVLFLTTAPPLAGHRFRLSGTVTADTAFFSVLAVTITLCRRQRRWPWLILPEIPYVCALITAGWFLLT